MQPGLSGWAIALLLAESLLTLALSQPAFATGPAGTAAAWRLDDVLPERLAISLNFRARYEYLDEQFRITRSGDEELVVLRTLVDTRLRITDWLTVGAEFQDSRAELSDDVLLTTGIVNTAELLRAYGEVTLPNVFGGRFESRFGRITLDVGSRRLVARNRFRNTLNAFTGVDIEWSGDRGHELRAFWLLPIQRLPFFEQDSLRNNEVKFDHESLDVQFWGLFGAARLPKIGRGELFVYGLHESDTNARPTRNRRLYTPGWRILRKPAPGRFDYQYEGAIQIGKSRWTPLSSRDLDHFAHFQHVEAGYTFDVPWSPRVALQYDYASGDEDPDDDDNQRFTTLFGARRFDFGPTGIYGPFARANLNTSGIRVQLKPHPRVTSFLAYRAYWLASKTDAWTTTGVRDPTGNSGSFIGSQIELRVRFQPLPGNLRLEAGYAHLFAGRFIKDAPNATHRGDSNYVYTQATLNF
ncbi:MAG: alginate export family protein [Deltaproteobacteria bacterium]|nr:alginate export family protein [Deltaproteobacteria bacterium]